MKIAIAYDPRHPLGHPDFAVAAVRFIEATAVMFDGFEEFGFAVHHGLTLDDEGNMVEREEWNVSIIEVGLTVSHGADTREDAIKEARARLERSGPERVRRAVASAIAENDPRLRKGEG